MSMCSICKHTIQESYESGHRKSTYNVTERGGVRVDVNEELKVL